jgi:hypothetical protein
MGDWSQNGEAVGCLGFGVAFVVFQVEFGWAVEVDADDVAGELLDRPVLGGGRSLVAADVERHIHRAVEEAVRAVSPSATSAPFVVSVPVPPAPSGSGPVVSNVNPISCRSGVSCRCRGCGC